MHKTNSRISLLRLVLLGASLCASQAVCAQAWPTHAVQIIVAIDVNTVSPPHDVNGMAASLAAALMNATLVLLCRHRGLDRDGTD